MEEKKEEGLPEETLPKEEGEITPPPDFVPRDEVEGIIKKAVDDAVEPAKKHFQAVADRQITEARRGAEAAKRETGRLREDYDFLTQRYLAGLPEEERIRAEVEMLKRQREVPQQPPVDPQDAALMALPDVHAKLIEEDISLDHPDLEWPTLETAPTVAKGRDVMLRSIRKIVSERKAQEAVKESVSEEKTKTKAEKKKPEPEETEEKPVDVWTGGIRSPASRGVAELRKAYASGEIKSSKEYAEQMRALGEEP